MNTAAPSAEATTALRPPARSFTPVVSCAESIGARVFPSSSRSHPSVRPEDSARPTATATPPFGNEGFACTAATPSVAVTTESTKPMGTLVCMSNTAIPKLPSLRAGENRSRVPSGVGMTEVGLSNSRFLTTLLRSRSAIMARHAIVSDLVSSANNSLSL